MAKLIGPMRQAGGRRTVKILAIYPVVYMSGLLVGALLTDQDSYFTGVHVGALSAICASFVTDVVIWRNRNERA